MLQLKDASIFFPPGPSWMGEDLELDIAILNQLVVGTYVFNVILVLFVFKLSCFVLVLQVMNTINK